MGSRKAKSSAQESSIPVKGSAKSKRKQMSTSTQNALWPTLVDATSELSESNLAQTDKPTTEDISENKSNKTDHTDGLEQAILTNEDTASKQGSDVDLSAKVKEESIVQPSHSEGNEVNESQSPAEASESAGARIQDSKPIKEFTKPSFEESLLALGSIKGLGRKSLVALFDALDGDLRRIWEIPPENIHKVLDEAKIPAAEKIVSEIVENRLAILLDGKNKFNDLTRRGIHIIALDKLPATLQQIPDPPRWLFVEGDPNVLYHKPAVAVVGTRNPSSQGITATTYVTRQLASYQVVLVSGLAEGIDEEAHRSSLQEGVKNIAFLGHGINMIFPSSTKSLREQIVQNGGAVATEYMPNERYQRHYFVERNRLQAALAQIVIPVQANPKGGTAHTIRFSRLLKREIIGIRWQGANGILDDLRRDSYPIIEIFTQQGRKQLDKILRNLAEKFNHFTYAFAVAERRLRNEIKSRDVRQSDIEQLIISLQEMSKEM